MKKFCVKSKQGIEIGTYEAETREEALEALTRELTVQEVTEPKANQPKP